MYYSVFYRSLCVLLITLIPIQTTIAFARGGGDNSSVESVQKKEKEREDYRDDGHKSESPDLARQEPISSDLGEEQSRHRTQAIAILNQMFQSNPPLTEDHFKGRRIDWERSHKIFSYLQRKAQSNQGPVGSNDLSKFLNSQLSEEEARDPDIILMNEVIAKFAQLSALQDQARAQHSAEDSKYVNVCDVGDCGPHVGKFPQCYPSNGCSNAGCVLFILHASWLVVQAMSLLSFIGCQEWNSCPEKYHNWSGNPTLYCEIDSEYANGTLPNSINTQDITNWDCVHKTGYAQAGLASLHVLPYLVYYSPYVIGNTLALGWKLGSLGCGLIYNGVVGAKNLLARGCSGASSWISKKYVRSQINHCEKDIEKNLDKLGKETGFTEFAESFDGLMNRMVTAPVNR